MIGLFSDSNGDLAAIDAAYDLLKAKGAKRFLFCGGRYSDLDEWLAFRKQKPRGDQGYSDLEFVSDVSGWLGGAGQLERGAAFGLEEGGGEEKKSADDLSRLLEKFTRTPERDSLQFRDSDLPKKMVDMLGDQLCCMVHDKNDLDRDDLQNSTVFIHGKQSEPTVVQIGPRFFVSPGQLSGAAEQTCGMFEVVDKKQLRFSAYRLDGHMLIDHQPLVIDRKKTKLSVK